MRPTLALFGFCLLVFVASAASQEQKAAAHNQKTSSEKSGSANDPLFVKVLPSDDSGSRAKEEKADREAKRESDQKLTEYTGQLAAYTERLANYTKLLIGVGIVQCLIFVLQLWAFAFQGMQLKRSVKVAETALTDLERPFIFADVREPVFEGVVITHGGQVSINFSRTMATVYINFVNHGKTPAILTELRVDDPAVKPSTDAFPNPIDPLTEVGDPLPEGMAVASGGTHRFAVEFLVARHDLLLDWIFFVGFLRYRDIFRKKHITGFCMRYDKSSNRLFLIGDQRYNYTRDE